MHAHVHLPGPMRTLALATLLEARRSGLPLLAVACIAGAIGLAAFVSQVAITESLPLQAALVGSLLRASAAFLVAAHVVTSVVREAADKGFELALSLPVSRRQFYLGRLLGHAAAGVSIATVFALPLLMWATPAAVGAWWLSLAFETLLVAALSLFFVFTLTHVVPALAAATGFYLLARGIASVQAIASGPYAGDGFAARAAQWAVDGVALLLPRLDIATRSDWLVYGAPGAGELGHVLASLAVYAALASAAGLVDFHRRNL
jgi:ABC-type transport system involved in multi-copper enzyme maturation permease subunit